MTPRLSNFAEADIISRYQAGDLMASITAEHGIDKVTVYNVLRRNDVPRRRRSGGVQVPFAPDEMDRIGHLRRSGATIEDLTDEMRCGAERIRRALRELGLAAPLRRRDAKDRIFTRHGYAYVLVGKDDPLVAMRGKNQYVLEHRLVMARHLGRVLAEYETVHHINGDRTDNRVENLQLRSGRHGKHAAYQCVDCGSRNVVPTTLL